MKHLVNTFALGVLTMFLFTVTPLANADDFTGLWEGIDAKDGSSIVVSITDSQNSGNGYDILWRESHFWRCKDGKGIVKGTASDLGASSLKITAMLYCVIGSKKGKSSKKGQHPVEPVLSPNVDVKPLLSLDFDLAILATTTGSSLTLHRISP